MLSSFSSKNLFIYIDDGFIESQYLWLLPIIDGYCDKLGIKNILFHKKISAKLKKNKYIKKFLKKYNIQYYENKNFRKINICVTALISLILFPFFLSLFNRQKLITEKNWYKLQFYHAFWDTALMLGKDGDIVPTLKNKYKSFVLIFYTLCQSTILKIKFRIHTVFLSHSVYNGRVLLANLRKSSIVLCQSAFNLYKQNQQNDECWSVLRNKKNLSKILKKIHTKVADNYWKKRITGKGQSYESNLINKFKSKKNIKNINVIMLHVFRDSAFNYIDKNRIFTDYIEWIYQTLKILESSNEQWYIRIHPFSYSWGENSHIFIETIKKKLNYKKNNLHILDKSVSNNRIFENAKRIITYSGTAFLESACYGKKSIIISDVLPFQYQKKISIKAKSLNEYKKLLLNKTSKELFFINNKLRQSAKKLLYCRENVTNLRSDTGGFFVYRNDSKNLKNKEYSLVSKRLHKKIKFFKNLGSCYSQRNFSHSLSSKFLNKIIF